MRMMTKRILSLLLCFVLVVGLVPATALAATDDTDYLFLATDRHANTSVIGNIINNMESTIGENKLDYLALGGDMVGSGSSHPAYNSSTVLAEVTGATSSLSAANVDIVAGVHDMNVTDDVSIVLPYKGGGAQIFEDDRFYVYGVPEGCISSEVSGVDPATEAQDFVTWANGSDIDKSKVIVVVSHYPLHAKRGDNTGAGYWHNALNTVATGSATGTEVIRNVVFFHGHNHTVDSTEYCYAPGSTMSIESYVAPSGVAAASVPELMTIYDDEIQAYASASGTNATIYYTYATAGYLNQNSNATLMAITDDEITLTKYSTSDSGTIMTTVKRVVTEPTLSSIAISGKTEYYVGDELALTVTATYSDGTTADVTADAEIAGYDMSAAGTQTVTAAYGEKTATTSITVTAVQISSIAVTTQPDKVTYTTGEELDTTGMVVTATYNNGTTAEVTGWYTSTVDMATAGEKTVTVNYAVDSITYKTTFTITVEEGVAEGVTLQSIKITNPPTKTEYLISEELNLDGMVVVATFSDDSTVELAYKPFSTSTVYGGYELDNFSMYVEKAHEVKVTYTYGDITCTDTTTINVWGETFEDETTGVTVSVGEDEYGVTAASVAESTNEHVTTAVADVMKEGYVAYDISLVFDEEYETTNATKTVTLPIPEGVSNPVVYYVSDDGETVTNMNAVKDGNGNVAFTTTHFSTYVIGESTEITVPENETATGSGETTTTTKKTVYVLTSSISSGNDYLIVNGNSAGSYYALANDSGSVADTGVTVKTDSEIGTYIELDDATDELWTVSNSYRFQNNGYYLRYNNGLGLSTSNYTTWSYSTTNNRLSYTSSGGGGGGSNTRYLRYNDGWTTTQQSNSATRIYFYVPTEIEVETTTTVSGTYSIEGEDLTAVVEEGSTANLVSTLTFTPDSGDATTTDVSTAATYEIVTVDANGNTVNGDPNGIISKIENGVVTFTGNYGTALLKVSYTTDFGVVTDYITIEATAPYYTIELCDPVTDDEGNTTYEPITKPVALKGVKAGDTYSVWAVVKEHTAANPEGVDLDELGDQLTWSVSDTSIATIDPDTGVITFTGTNYGIFAVKVAYTGADGKVITDEIIISATESLYVVPGDGTDDFPEYPNEGAVRFDKTATAVGNFSETGIAKVELSMTGVPYSTGSEIDVVVMLDMTGSMSDNGMEAAEEATKAFMRTIVINEDGTYNDNRIAVYAFNSGSSSPYELVALKTIKSDAELEDADTAIDTASDKQASGGTPYDESAKTCYDVLQAAKTDGIGNDRQQFCLFMSDGGPTSYEGSDGYTYYGGNNSSGDRAITSYISGYTSSTASDWSYTLPTEYYTDLMKADGVTVYTVGLLLQNAPSSPAPWSSMTDSTYDSTTDSLTTIGSHYYFTSTLLKNMATSSAHYIDIFSVDTADDATAKFQSIAQKIVEAAKDVTVEDKIGSNYSLNFSIPGYGTGNAVSEDALDGLTEFYIQVVEYQLNADKERTGDPYVKENFTFNTDGSLKSHTVDGVACESCTHVTTTDGVITAIDGTYFNYKSDSTGEYLTWEEDKISTTELALQYFAYLDSSSGVDPDDQIAAGTYYTNEYATLTYTNYNGNQVQQEFPIPQMTWNGAQVSYVFYLVNDDGQPVNRAGRVVPFAEAVYVTDVYTYSVIWNDLEQSAGLEAKYLAETLVPDVYALYDDDASYNIHVYEDEDEVNLNNHFVIGGDVTDAYNTTEHSWTNVKTTYVFNNKSDATKYNEVGAYIANDGDDASDSTSYYCKSATIEGATYTTSVDAAGVTVYTVTSVGDGYQNVAGETQVQASALNSTTGGTIIDGYVYYVDENGAVYTIVQKTDGKEVEQGFDFSNTTVAFAVVWKPELVEDVVVVDYGLDVVIDVITNDALASGVVGVRADKPDAEINSGSFTAAKTQSVDVYIDSNNDGENLKENKIGTATVENLNSVRFSLDKDNGMQFTDPAVFYYEADVNYYKDGELQTTSMYSSVTVIPATTVYYEDSFVEYDVYKKVDNAWTLDENATWAVDGTTVNATQAQDRPGASQISAAIDADNNYGYDAAYNSMSQYSMGSAKKITVDAATRGEATFTFYGTGFDVIGLTSNATGTLTVQVYEGTQATGTAEKTTVVDTYYGYKRIVGDDGTVSWQTTTSNDPNALYQVPVIKISGLDYAQYTVKITAGWNGFFDHVDGSTSYDLFLDAVRIYDPTGNQNDTANNAYKADGEGWPTYYEVRNQLIEATTFDELNDEMISGMVFIDGTTTGAATTAVVSDYTSYGPNNEVYLDVADAVTFSMNETAAVGEIAKIQLAVKTVGDEGKVEVYGIKDGVKIPCLSETITTATDMYYDITALNGMNVVIKNAGTSTDAIVSITNVKVTFTEEQPEAQEAPMLFSVRRSAVDDALMTLNTEEEEVPETTVPEETEPETTVPEESEPETSEPEITVPEETEPEETEPEETEPENNKPQITPEKVASAVKEVVVKVINALSKLFSRWF